MDSISSVIIQYVGGMANESSCNKGPFPIEHKDIQ